MDFTSSFSSLAKSHFLWCIKKQKTDSFWPCLEIFPSFKCEFTFIYCSSALNSIYSWFNYHYADRNGCWMNRLANTNQRILIFEVMNNEFQIRRRDFMLIFLVKWFISITKRKRVLFFSLTMNKTYRKKKEDEEDENKILGFFLPSILSQTF